MSAKRIVGVILLILSVHFGSNFPIENDAENSESDPLETTTFKALGSNFVLGTCLTGYVFVEKECKKEF